MAVYFRLKTADFCTDKMKRDALVRELKSYLKWPLALIMLWAVMVIVLFARNGRAAGITALIFAAVYSAFAVILFFVKKGKLNNDLIAFAAEYGQLQKNMVKEFPIPYALLDENANFLWMNDEFVELTGKDRHYHKGVDTLFPMVSAEDMPSKEKNATIQVTYGDKHYRAEFAKVHPDIPGPEAEDDYPDQEFLISMSLFDETELDRLMIEKEDNKPVVGFLYLDNYDEALDGVEDVRRSLLLALVERKINKYFNELGGIVRKLSHDRYFFQMRKKALDECEEAKFTIIDEVKEVNLGNELALTASIGIGVGGATYLENSDEAMSAVELALGRGGDQAVVKDGYRTRFYGGKTESSEKGTRVKARVKAHALKEIIDSRSAIVVMGHKRTDIDALGAAIGIYCAGRASNRPVHIVADDISEDVQTVIDGFKADASYPEDLFVSGEEAASITGPDTVLVVVDTDSTTYVACEELLSLTNTIVVLDHHRQGSDRIMNATLSYIEPYASSACEMVAEVMQYYDDELKLKAMEADALYAGIVVDTNNFVTRTGVRTFEAAAYLRSNGADVTRVRKLFRDKMGDLRAKAQTIAAAEIFDGVYAIAECPSAGLHSPTAVSAQAANELLDVIDIKASFVMTDFNGQIYISARAIDEVNVQLIMERLGGGGHLNIAGAQLPDYTMEEARELLKRTIREMKEEGDI